jgi:hypothetical protein
MQRSAAQRNELRVMEGNLDSIDLLGSLGH